MNDIEEIFNVIQKTVRSRLVSYATPLRIEGMDNYKLEMVELIRRTITKCESNSLLLIGPRGYGKSALVKSVLMDLEDEYNDLSGNYILVRLNGFLQTDDKIAIKEITKQLQLENVIGDRVFGSFAENLSFLLEALKSGNESKVIIFILDEFDMFCNHLNQSLLYNLFDIAQSSQTVIAVIGLTCRVDVIELLEKRVKSRFSHRQLFLHGLSFDEYANLFKEFLLLPNDILQNKFSKQWNTTIKDITQSSYVQDVLRNIYQITKSITYLKIFTMLLISKLDPNEINFSSRNFLEAEQMLHQNSKDLMLQGLSILEFSLIIAIKKRLDAYNDDPFNFEMIYHEYWKLGALRQSLLSEKCVALKAYERLQSLKFIRPAEGVIAANVQKQYRLMCLCIEKSVVNKALENYPNLPTEIYQWGSQKI